MSKLRNQHEKLANNSDKLFQHIEKIIGERKYWAKCYHLNYFTGGIDVCARNEASKAYLMQHFLRKDTPIEEAAKTISKSDCLQASE